MPEVSAFFRTLQNCSLGVLLWLCITHLEPVAEVVMLQSEVTKAQIKHALAANALLMKVKKYGEGVGLYFPRLTPPLRFGSVRDACGTKKESSYAQEGMLVLLLEDRLFSWNDDDLVRPGPVSRCTCCREKR